MGEFIKAKINKSLLYATHAVVMEINSSFFSFINSIMNTKISGSSDAASILPIKTTSFYWQIDL